MSPVKLSTILMVNDDPDDRVLMREAFARSRLRGDFCAAKESSWRLDFNPPKRDGREVLREIRATSMFKAIPITS
ncbi:MAG TPA: hypothetical protein VK717_08610 [Opitutaceae bacterium]|nr:hypothetical protein [Opitutaceae bacterium]